MMLNSGFGGAERIFVDTCVALANHGEQVLAVIHPEFVAKEQLQHERILVLALKARGRRCLLGKFRLYQLLKEHQPDVIHLHLRKAVGLLGRIGRRLRIPVIASMHNYGNVQAYRHADRIIALTPGQVPHITANGYPKDKVAVIPNFTQMEPLETERSYQTPRRFLAFGRFVEKKGFKELIQAVALAKEKGSKIQLTLGGGGPLEPELKELVKSLNLEPQIHFCGWIDDVKEALDNHDIFVLPSLSEPFGIVLLEAMARRVPIISTLTEGPKDFLTHETALLCVPENISELTKSIIKINQLSAIELQLQSSLGSELYISKFSKYTVIPALIRQFNLLKA